MSKDPTYDITMAAANLKAAAPEQFEALVQALRTLEQRYKSELLAAPPEVIFASQGRAAVVAQLVNRLEQCMEKRKAYQDRA